MKTVSAFLRLVRWQNLLFIAITQSLFYFAIVQPRFSQQGLTSNLEDYRWLLLIISSVLIAAGGNIINDYFDLNIDIINKPNHVIIDRYVRRRWALVWHITLSVVGIALGFYVDATSQVKFLGFTNLACVLLLFVYSTSLKKRLLIGNILISLLSAWTVLVVTFCETSNFIRTDADNTRSLTRITFLYGGFAYVISLIREVIKDMEDMEGDRRYGCKTMPISWGVFASKVFVSVWLFILIALLVIVQFYVAPKGWWLSVAYCVVVIILPLIWIFMNLFKTHTPAAYHKLSANIKWTMLAGIVSMAFFWYYS